LLPLYRTRPQPPTSALLVSTDMASRETTQADRVARSLKRLGFRMTRVGRSFTIIDNTGELAGDSKTGMSLAEIERWISEHIKPQRSGRH
jgi:hypothetical protein